MRDDGWWNFLAVRIVGSYRDSRTIQAMEIKYKCVMIKDHLYTICRAQISQSDEQNKEIMLPFFTWNFEEDKINVVTFEHFKLFYTLVRQIMNMLLKHLKENQHLVSRNIP